MGRAADLIITLKSAACELTHTLLNPQLRYFGLSSFELVVGDTCVLVDPWIEDPELSSWTVAEFNTVDYVLVTHGARDYLGDTLPIARRTGATVVTEPAVADHEPLLRRRHVAVSRPRTVRRSPRSGDCLAPR